MGEKKEVPMGVMTRGSEGQAITSVVFQEMGKVVARIKKNVPS